jgi:hypothetical protein
MLATLLDGEDQAIGGRSPFALPNNLFSMDEGQGFPEGMSAS